MKHLFAFLIFAMSISASAQKGFKQQQLKFERVRTAYNLKWASLEKDLQKAGFDHSFEILFNYYKVEGQLEVWLKTAQQNSFTLFKTYSACSKSGTLGPKVIEGDLQTPEGFYKLNAFNPMSLYHLSLGVDYPNAVDKARTGKDRKTGGDIYIHGDCVTIGCVPLTDEKIREVYVLAVEARDNGQKEIPVNIFPFRMTKVNFERQGKFFPQHIVFWKTLQPGFDYFENNKRMAKVAQVGGKYSIQ